MAGSRSGVGCEVRCLKHGGAGAGWRDGTATCRPSPAIGRDVPPPRPRPGGSPTLPANPGPRRVTVARAPPVLASRWEASGGSQVPSRLRDAAAGRAGRLRTRCGGLPENRRPVHRRDSAGAECWDGDAAHRAPEGTWCSNEVNTTDPLTHSPALRLPIVSGRPGSGPFRSGRRTPCRPTGRCPDTPSDVPFSRRAGGPRPRSGRAPAGARRTPVRPGRGRRRRPAPCRHPPRR